MKVAIMTFVRAYNYGAVLQAYALNKVINEMGVECETIDYFPHYFKSQYYLKKSPYINYRFPQTGQLKIWLFDNLYTFRLRSIIKKRNRLFSLFIKRNIKLSKKRYYSKESLNAIANTYDLYIAGSDQIWHNLWSDFDDSFFLCFVDRHKFKSSYAASFGFSTIPKELESEYQARLNRFDRISVREQSAIDIIKKTVGKTATCECDPTILLRREQWELLVTQNNQPDYIFVYYINKADNIFKKAYELSKAKNLKVICLTSRVSEKIMMNDKIDSYNFTNIRIASPADFLNLCFNAKYIITNSFHGTVFSIIFHKQFMSEVFHCDGEINIRSKELLNKTGLCNRTAHSLLNIDDQIDWSVSDNYLEKLRHNGLQYISSLFTKEGLPGVNK